MPVCDRWLRNGCTVDTSPTATNHTSHIATIWLYAKKVHRVVVMTRIDHVIVMWLTAPYMASLEPSTYDRLWRYLHVCTCTCIKAIKVNMAILISSFICQQWESMGLRRRIINAHSLVPRPIPRFSRLHATFSAQHWKAGNGNGPGDKATMYTYTPTHLPALSWSIVSKWPRFLYTVNLKLNINTKIFLKLWY